MKRIKEKEGFVNWDILAFAIKVPEFRTGYLKLLRAAYLAQGNDPYEKAARCACSTEGQILRAGYLEKKRDEVIRRVQSLSRRFCGGELLSPLFCEDNDGDVDQLIDDIWTSGVRCVRLGLIAA